MRDKNVRCINFVFLSFILHLALFLSRISHFYLAPRIFFISHLAFLSRIECFSSLIKSHLECLLQASVAIYRAYGFVGHPYFYCHFQTGSKI